MGCGQSIEKKIPKEWFRQFYALKLTRSEIRRLYDLFRKIDMDRSGSIDIVEMLTFLDIENTSFNHRVFSVFDMNKSGRVDFREFVLSLWNYCTLGNATLDIFTFDLYDKDRSGVLSGPEIEVIIRDLYGKHYAENPKAKSILHELKQIEKHDTFNVEKFAEFAKYHQGLLFPAFQLQHMLQGKILGHSFWGKCSNRRIELSKGKYISLRELMELHLHKDLEAKVMNTVIQPATNNKKQQQTREKAILAVNSLGTAHNRVTVDYSGLENQQQQQ